MMLSSNYIGIRVVRCRSTFDTTELGLRGTRIGRHRIGRLTREWYIDSIMATLVAASGLVAGRIYQRIVRIRVCGDHLCRARIGNGNTCSFCGAKMTRARTHG